MMRFDLIIILAISGLNASSTYGKAPESVLDWKSSTVAGTEFVAGKPLEIDAPYLLRSFDAWKVEVRVKYGALATEVCGFDDCTNQPTYCAKAGRIVALGKNEIDLQLDGRSGMTSLRIAGKKIASSVLFKSNNWHTVAFSRCAGKPEVKSFLDGNLMKTEPASNEIKITVGKVVIGDLDGIMKGLVVQSVTFSPDCNEPVARSGTENAKKK